MARNVEMTARRRYVGIQEAAELLGVSRRTVLRMIKAQQLRTAVVGQQRKVTMASIDALDPERSAS